MSVESPTWDAAREALRGKVSPHVFTSWISRMTVVADEGSRLCLGLPDQFGIDWFNAHYRQLLEDELKPVTFELILSAEAPVPVSSASGAPPPTATPPPAAAPTPVATSVPTTAPNARLNPRYTFQSFVVGPSNQLAYSACQSVVESRQAAYNPLVLVGGTGFGKTHLLHAVAHALHKKRPSAVVQLKTSEDFTNDVVGGIRTRNTEELRRAYRACDVLLLDDIQFFSGKPAVQEEFFHTFNVLHDAQKQIIVTSDRLPHEIAELQDRVKTRFAWGLIADLKLPELETRVAILKKKAEADQFELDDEIAQFIAQAVRTNVRELEGCLIRVHAYATLTHQPLTLALAREVLKGLVSDRTRTLSCELILKTVAQVFDLKVADLKSTKRSRAIALPRQISMYLCRKHTGSSYPEIGNAHGGKDHTTALAAYKAIPQRMSDPEVSGKIEEIERLLFD